MSRGTVFISDKRRRRSSGELSRLAHNFHQAVSLFKEHYREISGTTGAVDEESHHHFLRL
jgi:hypothetical protein